LDPIASLAEADRGQLEALLADVRSDDGAVDALLKDLAAGTVAPRGPAGTVNDPMAEWRGMPEFQNEDQTAWKTLKVHFKSEEDLKAFAELVGQTVTEQTRSIWYPQAEVGRYADKRYADGA
jgi:hypothetical protein